MPTAARRPCTWPGCPELVDGSGNRCERHRRAADRERGTAHERGYTSAWRRESKRYLQRHPLCECEQCLDGRKRVMVAEVVDHIVPHRGDSGLFWDRSNWQAMSKACHDRKTATQDGAFGRATAAGGPGGGRKV